MINALIVLMRKEYELCLSINHQMNNGNKKYLNQNKSLKETGTLMSKNYTTISRKTKNHYVTKNTGD